MYRLWLFTIFSPELHDKTTNYSEFFRTVTIFIISFSCDRYHSTSIIMSRLSLWFRFRRLKYVFTTKNMDLSSLWSPSDSRRIKPRPLYLLKLHPSRSTKLRGDVGSNDKKYQLIRLWRKGEWWRSHSKVFHTKPVFRIIRISFLKVIEKRRFSRVPD